MLVSTINLVLIFSIILSASLAYLTFFGEPIRYQDVVYIGILSVVLSLLYGSLYKLSRLIARKFFYLSVYDYERSLLELTLGLSKFLETKKLSEVVTSSLKKTIRPDKVAVLVRDFNTNYYRIETNEGFKDRDCLGFVYDVSIISLLEGRGEICILDKLNQILSENISSVEKEALKKLQNQMVETKSSIIVPILQNEVMISVILLGSKVSKSSYSVQDIDLLKTLATQSGVSLENARLYNEVTNFNEELKLKVQDATANLQRANSRLKMLDKLKDDFVSMASHELRTPMTAIRSYVWMAISHSDLPLPSKVKNYLTKVLFSTERLIHLVNDILNISRIESGKIEVKPEVFDVKSLIKEVFEALDLKAREKDISLEISEKEDLPKVFADPDKIMEVLLNLVGNALKFTPSSGRVWVSFFADGEMLDVSISDNGVGIATEDLGKLFTKFGRLDNSYVVSATSGGTGLGLYICKSLIELSGGRAWVESEGVGKGATFTFSLPLASKKVTERISYLRRAHFFS